MDTMKKTLLAGLPELGLELSPETAEKLCAFGDAVVHSLVSALLGTVITVVLVVGAMPKAHTSSGCPVQRQMSASCAKGLSPFPVMTMNFRLGFSRRLRMVSSTISRVLPELLMSSSRSFS